MGKPNVAIQSLTFNQAEREALWLCVYSVQTGIMTSVETADLAERALLREVKQPVF